MCYVTGLCPTWIIEHRQVTAHVEAILKAGMQTRKQIRCRTVSHRYNHLPDCMYWWQWKSWHFPLVSSRVADWSNFCGKRVRAASLELGTSGRRAWRLAAVYACSCREATFAFFRYWWVRRRQRWLQPAVREHARLVYVHLCAGLPAWNGQQVLLQWVASSVSESQYPCLSRLVLFFFPVAGTIIQVSRYSHCCSFSFGNELEIMSLIHFDASSSTKCVDESL